MLDSRPNHSHTNNGLIAASRTVSSRVPPTSATWNGPKHGGTRYVILQPLPAKIIMGEECTEGFGSRPRLRHREMVDCFWRGAKCWKGCENSYWGIRRCMREVSGDCFNVCRLRGRPKSEMNESHDRVGFCQGGRASFSPHSIHDFLHVLIYNKSSDTCLNRLPHAIVFDIVELTALGCPRPPRTPSLQLTRRVAVGRFCHLTMLQDFARNKIAR
jgi:hypothetical protein